MRDTQPLRFSVRLIASAVSEKGRSHEQNEDCYRMDVKRGLFLVADGMGGHRAGEVASRTAIEIIYQVLSSEPPGDWQQIFENALIAAHHAIRESADANEQHRGMGTTALIGWIRLPELHLWTAHIGNSCAFLWRKGTLQQLTEDHTIFNELRKAQRLPSNPLDGYPPHVLSQALGSRQLFLSPDFGDWRLEIGDRLLFCSDGVSDVLSIQEIQQAFDDFKEPQKVCNSLVEAVHSKGIPDDLTAIVVAIELTVSSEKESQIAELQELEV